jgi:hypothetical protein
MEYKKSPTNQSKFAEVTKKAQEERAKKPKQSREPVNHFTPRPEEALLPDEDEPTP